MIFLQTLVEVRPTRFLGVPRVWEKIQERLLEVDVECNNQRSQKSGGFLLMSSCSHAILTLGGDIVKIISREIKGQKTLL